MGHVLMEIERRVHRYGWDQMPVLFAVCGPGKLASGWTEEALLTEPANWPVHPRVVLAQFSAFLNDEIGFVSGTPDHVVAAAADARDFILSGLTGRESALRALVLVSESYALMGTAEGRARYPGELADHPDAEEARTVYAISPDGVIWMVQRIRGRKPGGGWWWPRTREHGLFGAEDTVFAELGGATFRGTILGSMQGIVNAVNRRAGRPLLELAEPIAQR